MDGDTTAEVVSYSVSVAADEKHPYYESDAFTVVPQNPPQTAETIKLTVKGQTLTLAPSVVGDQTSATFPMTVKFTNSNGVQTDKTELTITKYPTNLASAQITVPVGIDFEVKQTAVSGYKLDPTYTVAVENGESETQTGKATGTIAEGIDVTVATRNIMQNRSYPFSVTWMDGGNPARPTLSGSNFRLMYKRTEEEGDWTEVTEASLEALGIDKLPTCQITNAAQGQYAYQGLPSVDKEEKRLSYRVEPVAVDGYTISSNEANDHFTYWQSIDFTATISWADSSNAEGKRPDALELTLYRRVGNGKYQLVQDSVTVQAGEGNIWNVQIEGLPRFDGQCMEYDYAAISNTLNGYATSYHNGTGNFASDGDYCHNGGTIRQRLTGEKKFQANAVWKDTQTDSSLRPDATVTLWRYAIPE